MFFDDFSTFIRDITTFFGRSPSILTEESDRHFLVDVDPLKRIFELFERNEIVGVDVSLRHHPFGDLFNLKNVQSVK